MLRGWREPQSTCASDIARPPRILRPVRRRGVPASERSRVRPGGRPERRGESRWQAAVATRIGSQGLRAESDSAILPARQAPGAARRLLPESAAPRSAGKKACLVRLLVRTDSRVAPSRVRRPEVESTAARGSRARMHKEKTNGGMREALLSSARAHKQLSRTRASGVPPSRNEYGRLSMA
jgi:hypothetical protein